jgi:peptidyl-prolyl cis-trans isomerase C
VPTRPKAEPKRSVVRLVQNGGEEDGALRSEIHEVELRRALARLRLEREGSVHAAPLPPSLKGAVLEELIQRRILALEAQALGVKASTTAVAKELGRMTEAGERQLAKWLIDTYQTADDLSAAITERLTVAQLLRQEAHRGVEVSEDEIVAAWNQLPEAERSRRPRVHASQIVVRTEEEGNKVVAALKKGSVFEDLARAHSIGPEGTNGGDLGWFEQGSMPKVFDLCFLLKPQQTSPLTPSEYGFHVFRVHEIQPGAALTLDDLRDSLRSKVWLAKLEEAEKVFLRRVSSKYRVERDEARIASIE